MIDLAGSAAGEVQAATARAIDQALRETGFFTVTGHGVAPGLIAAALQAGRDFFALPEDTKARWHIALSAKRRGFDPIGWQALDPQRPPDLKESFYLGNPALGPNPWPDAMLLPGFRDACEAYTQAVGALSRRLLVLFAHALTLPLDFFDAYMRQPVATTRLLHYPPQPADAALAAPGQIGCGAHTDWGALTLLAQDSAGGLQVQPAGGAWLDVPPAPGHFVVNVGEMMQRWTNDRWPSTLHRVVNRHAGVDRYSIAYFCDLDDSALIMPLPGCTSAEQPARYGPITAGEHLEAMYRRTTVGA